MVSFKSRWMDWEPETPKYGTAKTDKRGGKGAFGGFVSSIVGDISPETPDLTGVIPVREGTLLQRLAYEARDKRLIAECRSKAVELQAWLAARFDRHMKTDLGLPEWLSALIDFDIVERGHLRGIFRYPGCIHYGGQCPDDAPVVCSACEGHDG